MTVTPADLCRVFQDRAAATYELIAYSYSVGIGVSEETITDVNLVELTRALPRLHVVTKKFTKLEESASSGADWLWTIGRPGRWLSLLVQAKIARPGASTVPKLHHGKGHQRQLLVDHARANNWVPLYVVYCALPAPPTTTRQRRLEALGRLGDTCAAVRADHRQAGCLAVRPRTVARMHRARGASTKISKLVEDGLPWATLFCCPPADGPIAELADAALAGVRALPIDTPDPRSPGGSASNTPDDIFDLDSDTLLTRDLPPIAQAVLDGRPLDESPAIGAVTIVSSASLDVRAPADDRSEPGPRQ